MQKDKSKENQNLFDFCIEKYGSLEFISNLVFDNDIKFDTELSTGTELLTNENLGIVKNKNSFKESLRFPVSTPEIGTIPESARIYADDSYRVFNLNDDIRIYE